MEFAKEKEQFIKGYKLIGEILSSVGYFEEALSFFEKSLKLAEEIEDLEKQISILNSIAGTYSKKGETKKSLEYYQKALQLHNNVDTEEKPSKIEIATIYNNIAITYNKEKEYQKAIEYLKKAIEIGTQYELTDPEKLLLYKLNLGYTYMEIKDYKNAEKYLSEALKGFKKIKDKSGEAKSYRYLALYYKEKGEIEKAIECYQKAYKILNSIDKKDDAEKILEEIEELNKQTVSL
jgi:tetratricopeptide (TPR) repeat protein